MFRIAQIAPVSVFVLLTQSCVDIEITDLVLLIQRSGAYAWATAICGQHLEGAAVLI
jgi:hypothetical protein